MRRVTDTIAQVLSTADHDLLIRISEKLEGLSVTCNNLTVALSNKADASAIMLWRDDHEKRIRTLEQFNFRLAGALAALQVLGVVVLHYWK